VHWDNKKRLLFLLDYAAWTGIEDKNVRAVLHAGGDLAVQVMKRMLLAEKAGGDQCPWAAANIERYLVDETIPALD